ncbi:SLBB domain-containing protein [Salinibacter sp. 10B]|uniref:SLBB domain-containing protein n=1 Tax=Salinibacter sp. 10B TaxID=1923971 RepID=UPI001C6129A8|nr:SLBB domain-containing protein [Salinibacter sp. 10B]
MRLEAWGVALLLTVVCGALVAPQALRAQAFGRVEETKSNVAYFYHARPGEATVQLSVWGTVPRPGVYEVPDTTDLDKLLTMAGGAPMEARVEDRKAPTITVRVYRPGTDGRNQIFESELDRMLRGSPSYPSLQDNDIVVVETVRPKQPFGWRDVLSVLSTLGTLTLLGLRIFTRV